MLLSFSIARSESEVESAFILAMEVFGEFSGSSQYLKHKTSLWREDPTYRKENFVLAKTQSGKVCGLVRIVPRKIFRGTEVYSVAGISSVCLSPMQRGNGNSLKLMEFALECCKKRKFEFAFLFARRSADRYYTRFGFHGISSYSQLKIKYAGLPSNSEISVGPASKKHIAIYSAAYEECYSRVFGRVERSEQYWSFLLSKFHFGYPDRIETIFLAGVSVGYVVLNNNKIHELAFAIDINPQEMIGFLSQKFPSLCKGEEITLDLPPQHSLISGMHGIDLIITQRECSFGGHMACILKPQVFLQRVLRRNMLITDDLVQLSGRVHLNHYETCRLLGVASITHQAVVTDAVLPFNMSIVDHF
jgi:predicted acetyltransferase